MKQSITINHKDLGVVVLSANGAISVALHSDSGVVEVTFNSSHEVGVSVVTLGRFTANSILDWYIQDVLEISSDPDLDPELFVNNDGALDFMRRVNNIVRAEG